MDFDFTWVLLVLLTVAGGAWSLDRFWHRPKRMLELEAYRKNCEQQGAEPDEKVVNRFDLGPTWLEFPASLFGVLILVFVLRSFVVEPFTIPSSSMEPTLQVGDYILVNKWVYGVRVPLVGTRLIGDREPDRGDIMVFRNPENPRINYIKRVVGIPGDHIEYENKRLTINGEPAPVELVKKVGSLITSLETLGAMKHSIQVIETVNRTPSFSFKVNEGEYFVLGDNRDNSRDSRVWGTVPDDHIVGKAFAIWMHMPNWWPSFSRNRLLGSEESES